MIRVYDEAGNVIETHEHKGEFKEWGRKSLGYRSQDAVIRACDAAGNVIATHEHAGDFVEAE